ncbi:MAG: alternative ribosome rescue factor ArfA [Patescibacteria group bacterium]
MAKKKRPQVPAKRNVMAQALESPLFAHKIVRPKKGRGAYKRKEKHGTTKSA